MPEEAARALSRRPELELHSTDLTEADLKFLFLPPLMLWRHELELPRTVPALLQAQRNLVESSHTPGIARYVLRAAFSAYKNRIGFPIQISNADLSLKLDLREPSDIPVAAELLTSIARAMLAVIGQFPPPAWREAVRRAWLPLTSALGADLDSEKLRLRYQRGKREVEVSVRFERDQLVTIVRIVVGSAIATELDRSAALARVEALGAHVVLEATVLVATRPGLIASSDALHELIDAVIDLATELADRRGPYR